MNEFEYLKESLYDLWGQMEREKINLGDAVDALCSLARFYEKMGASYQQRVKLNERFKKDV